MDPHEVRTSAMNLYNKIRIDDFCRSFRNSNIDNNADSGNKIEHKDNENITTVSPLEKNIPCLMVVESSLLLVLVLLFAIVGEKNGGFISHAMQQLNW